MGIKSHVWRAHGEGKNHEANESLKNGNRVIWNKGLTKKTDKRVLMYSEELSKKPGTFKNKKHTIKSRIKISNAIKEAISTGKKGGWSIRNKSYPEKYFEEVLRSNNIFDKCITEYKILKSELGDSLRSCYYLDFYFPDKKIDLEIDGQQHESRKCQDAERDRLLLLNGYKVFRIKWKNPVKNKHYIEEEIKRFIKFYNSEV